MAAFWRLFADKDRVPSEAAPRATVPCVANAWDAAAPGVVSLPSGRLVRGRAIGAPLLPDVPHPEFGVYLLARQPPEHPWEAAWIRWPDFGLPTDRRQATAILRSAWVRTESERVEIACRGGRGRTGTALACLAVLDGLSSREAVTFVRKHYSPRAVETPWQRWYVGRFERARMSG